MSTESPTMQVWGQTEVLVRPGDHYVTIPGCPMPRLRQIIQERHYLLDDPSTRPACDLRDGRLWFAPKVALVIVQYLDPRFGMDVSRLIAGMIFKGEGGDR